MISLRDLARGGGMPLSRRLIIGLLAGGASVGLLGTAPDTFASGGPVRPPQIHAATTSLAGQSGVAQPPADTPSAVTVTGKANTPFANLSVTVSQTTNLLNQGIGVHWQGCTQNFSLSTDTIASGYNCGPTYSEEATGSFSGKYSGNYLQIFECWSPPEAADPQPQNCEFGAESENSNVYPASFGAEYERILAEPSDPDYSKITGWTDPSTNYKVEPFTAVDGTTINQQANYNYDPNNPATGSGFWQNPYFEYETTNEVDFARINPDGKGSTTFEADTGLEAPGLGCGQQTYNTPAGLVQPKCWLVVVPRSTAEISSTIPGDNYVDSSPLRPSEWTNHLAVPLSFANVGACSLGSNSRRIAGSELAVQALSNWEPALCNVAGHSPYTYTPLPDDTARNQLASGSYGAAPMIVTSAPIDPSLTDPAKPVTYAPLTLSGAVISFNIDRYPSLDPKTSQDYADEQPYSGTPVASIKLTPRLVAKLLTQSYEGQFYSLGRVGANLPSAAAWVAANPSTLFDDPDFRQYNPEFAELTAPDKATGSRLVVEQPDSDAAATVWQWVTADKSAREWLSGVPDPWGMKVNPYYSTNADLNPSSVAFDNPALSSFPLNDPTCGLPPQSPPIGGQQPPAECFTNIDPYTLSMATAATSVLSTNVGAHATPNPFAPYASEYWGADGPQSPGKALVMAITDSASAARYGDQVAQLSQANDDGSSPTFITPGNQSYLNALSSMSASAVATVLQPNPGTTAAGAYPLTLLTYAAIQPSGLDAASLSDYAAFLSFAATSGQVSGTAAGQLPPGFAPLPASLASQTLAAAKALTVTPTAASTTTTTAPVPTPSVPSRSAGPSPVVTPEQQVFTPTDTATTTAGSATSSGSSTSPTTALPSASLPPKTKLATSKTPAFSASDLRLVPLAALLIGLIAAFGAPLTSPKARAALRRPPQVD